MKKCNNSYNKAAHTTCFVGFIFASHAHSPAGKALKPMRVIVIFVTTFLLFLSNAIADDMYCGTKIHFLRWLDHADPMTDAKEDIKNGNIFFLGVYREKYHAPGITEDDFAHTGLSINAIEGATTKPCSDTHKIYSDMAYNYAVKYNQFLLKHVYSNGFNQTQPPAATEPLQSGFP